MRKLVKRLTCALLLLSTLTAAAACGETAASPAAQTTADTSAAATEAETTTAAETPALPDEDFGGATFTVLVRKGGDVGDPWGDAEMAADEQNGEALNDAIIARDRVVEEKYNVTIAQQTESDGLGKLKKAVMAGDTAYDLAMLDLFSCTTAANNGVICDLNTLKNLDFSHSWWDASSVRDLSIGQKQYFVTGDYSFRNFNASWIYAFNKQMITDYSLDNPYDLVSGGKWTIDKFSEMMTGVLGDVNGDGVMDENDRYGLITEESNSLGMFFGAGNAVISKDADNYPTITIYTDRSVATLEKVFTFMNDASVTTSASDKYYSKYSADPWGALVKVFSDNRGLFYSIVMYTVKKLRNMVSDFGLLPMPKYDEAQEDYCTWVSPYIASGLMIPTTADTEKSTVISEYMCYASQSTVRPAYYDVSLAGKYTRDNDSAAMIDIILGNRVYDLGMIYNWGGVGTLINGMTTSKKSDFTSAYQKIAEKAQTALDKSIEEFKAEG